MSNYQPELGQAAFGQPYKERDCPDYVEAALIMIREELERVLHNTTDSNYSNPFDNSGGEFKCEEFEACAYSWSDDEQLYNFKWRDIEISWYKYLGRGMSMNKKLTPQVCSTMLTRCLKALLEYEKEHDK